MFSVVSDVDWNKICLNIILGYDFQLYEQKMKTKELLKEMF